MSDILDIMLAYGMPPYREPRVRRQLADAIRWSGRHSAPGQYGPVTISSQGALYDCPCLCGLLTSEPAKLCSCCNELKPATHWDGLVNVCGDCAPKEYGE